MDRRKNRVEITTYLLFVGVAEELDRLQIDGTLHALLGVLGPPLATASSNAAERYHQDYEADNC